jgi:hypothetical protein
VPTAADLGNGIAGQETASQITLACGQPWYAPRWGDYLTGGQRMVSEAATAVLRSAEWNSVLPGQQPAAHEDPLRFSTVGDPLRVGDHKHPGLIFECDNHPEVLSGMRRAGHVAMGLVADVSYVGQAARSLQTSTEHRRPGPASSRADPTLASTTQG